MPLPTMSLRVAPEHQQLIRDVAAALRTRPEMVGVLRDVLRTQHDDAPRITDRNTDVLQSILEQVAAIEARVDAIEARVDALEEREPRMTKIAALEADMAAMKADVAALKDLVGGSGMTAAAPPRHDAPGHRR